MAQQNAGSVKKDQTLDKNVEKLDKKVEALDKNFAKKLEDLDKKFAGELSGLNNKVSNLNWLYSLIPLLAASLGLHIFQLIQSKNKFNNMSAHDPKTPLVVDFSSDAKNSFENIVRHIMEELKANRSTIETILKDFQANRSNMELGLLKLLENQNLAINELARTNQQLQEIGQTIAQVQKEIKNTNKEQVTLKESTKDTKPGQSEEVGTHPEQTIEKSPESESPSTPIATDKNEQQLIEDYNNNDIKGSYGELIEVSVLIDSIKSIRGGSGEKPILTKQSPSKYWIIRDKYLVPKYDKLDNSAMGSVVRYLFDCLGYQQEVSNANQFTLKRTGKVQKVGDSWELVEKGVLDYNR
jgi:hypothetical protein